MPEYLDIENWPRRDLFEFFRGYERPHFNVCTRLDITSLVNLLRELPGVSVSLAYLYFALRVANEIEPFHYRLKEGRVVVHDVINGGTTVLLPNESFSYAYFDYEEDFEQFMFQAQRSVSEAAAGSSFNPTTSDDTIYFTTLPWISFTSFAHARNLAIKDSV